MKKLILFQIVFFWFIGAQAQMVMERVFLHSDQDFYITGESLWFSAYCLNDSDHKLSTLSKVLNVDLIGPGGYSVKQARIRLENGRGHGDFLITPDLPTGYYQLRAYTQWMKNFPDEHIFRGNITVLNPSSPPENQTKPDTLESKSSPSVLYSNEGITTDKSQYGNRQKVEVQIELPEGLSYDLSVSVYRKSRFRNQSRYASIKDYFSDNPIGSDAPSDIIYPPELNGPQLSLVFSEPGNPDQLFIAFPGNFGFFNGLNSISKPNAYLEFPWDITADNLYLTSNGSSIEENQISIMSPYREAGELDNQFPYLDKTDRQDMQHHIANIQISQSYSANTLINGSEHTPEPKEYFYGKANATYNLDDYTRFKTLRESFIEYINEAGIKKTNKKNSFHIRNSSGLLNQEPALLLYDGVPVWDSDLILNMNPDLIKQVDIINEPYYAGDRIHPGLINFITYEENFGGIELPENIIQKRYYPVSRGKEFHSPVHDKGSSERIPDFRNVLYWNPRIIIDPTGKKNFHFFTGDDSGEYEIVVSGINSEGDLITIQQNIQVGTVDN